MKRYTTAVYLILLATLLAACTAAPGPSAADADSGDAAAATQKTCPFVLGMSPHMEPYLVKYPIVYSLHWHSLALVHYSRAPKLHSHYFTGG